MDAVLRNRLGQQARDRAALDLCKIHAEEYRVLVDRRRAQVGLGPVHRLRAVPDAAPSGADEFEPYEVAAAVDNVRRAPKIPTVPSKQPPIRVRPKVKEWNRADRRKSDACEHPRSARRVTILGRGICDLERGGCGMLL